MEETVGTENIDVRNNFRLLSLLNTTVNAFLRKWFRKNWQELVNSEWEDDGDCRIRFVKGVGQELFSRSKPIQTNCLKTLSNNLWDLPLLADAVNCMQGKLGRQKSKHFNGLKAIRNKLMHMGNMEISNEEFKNSWANISVILLSLGIPQMELDVAKTINFKNDVNPKPEDILNKANRKNAENLRKRGNSLFNEKNYEGAIVSYSEAILIPDLPGNYSAVLYANRSLASLKLGDLQAAKGDARGAMHMRPNWWKGYARLANVYQELKKYGKALQFNEIALGIRPTAVDVKDARDFCRLVVAKTARCEHLDPLNFATTFEDTVKRSEEIDGIRTDAYAFTDYQKMNLEVGNPVSICGDGHKYLHGNGVAQNFETAARLYAKAASKGSAEGLYNLAILTDEGKGVKRNILEATRMYFEAAAQEPFVDVLPGSAIKVPNIGVMESQHALGLAYQNGVGVEQNYIKAIEWYEKALLNGSGNSANNLAIMYLDGNSVAVNIDKGYLFWKVASLKGCIRAMENLALNYATFNMKDAQKWFTVAVEKGSMRLPLRRKEFMLDKLPLNKFNSEEFLEDIMDELMKGPLKHFAKQNKHTSKNFSKMMGEQMKTSDSLKPQCDYRTQMILDHRLTVKEMKYGADKFQLNSTCPAKFVPSAAADLIGLKSIYFRDMKDQNEDHVYEGFAIKLTLVEDATLGRPSIALIAQDENGDIQRIFVYNYPQNKDTQSSLGYGCRITIINPYFRITRNKKAAIRVDEPSLLFANPKIRDEKRCRYCGQDNGTMRCRTCKRVFYCSKLCLKKDSEDLQHSLVCFKHL